MPFERLQRKDENNRNFPGGVWKSPLGCIQDLIDFIFLACMRSSNYTFTTKWSSCPIFLFLRVCSSKVADPILRSDLEIFNVSYNNSHLDEIVLRHKCN